MEADDVRLHPHGFRREHVPVEPDRELAGLIFVLDVQDGLPAVVRLRDWATDRLAPQPGELAVDVGSGTGSEVLQLAELVGADGRAVGVEPHDGLRAEAESRAEASGSRAEFVDAVAGALPFEDGTVDVLRCERVFQHLADPQGAAREFARVLAPGGRVAILDSDWATAVTAQGDPDVVDRVNRTMWARAANPFAGRHLRAQLRRTGLEVEPDIGSAALIVTDDLAMLMLSTGLDAALEAAAITPQEADALRLEMTSAIAVGEAFLSVTMFAVIATKPLAP